MKKFFIIGLLLIIIVLGVSASSVLLDKTSIEKTAKPTAGFSDAFKITNNGTASITDLKIEKGGTGLNGFNISTLPYSLGTIFTLNAASQVTFTLTGTVPKDVTTRETPYTDALRIYSGLTEVGSIDLKITAESQLELDKVKFVVDGKSKSIGEGDTRKDVLPGAKLKIEGDIENTFTNDDDIAIEDATVEITIDGIDDGDDLDGDEDVGDIDADDKESFSIEFDIPEDVEADEYDVTILVEGEDENGAKHSVEWDDVKLKVEKDKHDIWITKATLSPLSVDCSRKVSLNVELKNQGESDEDEVVLIIESTELEIAEEDTSIPEIEEGTGDDTEYEKTYTFEIDDKLKEGTYPIAVEVYYDTDTLSDLKSIDLRVEKCVVEEEEEEEEEGTVVVGPPSEEEEEGPEILTTPITETTEVSLLQSNTYLMFLIGAVGVAVVVVIIMIVILFSMKRKREI